jgi:hypothetical protein
MPLLLDERHRHDPEECESNDGVRGPSNAAQDRALDSCKPAWLRRPAVDPRHDVAAHARAFGWTDGLSAKRLQEQLPRPKLLEKPTAAVTRREMRRSHLLVRS